MKPYPSDMHLGATKEVFRKAQMLRNNETLQEAKLWAKLKNYKEMGYHFRRQHPIGFYVADFYCHGLRLVVEIDGDSHSRSNIKSMDQEKLEFYSENNVKVLRFTNEEVDNDVKKVLEVIESQFPK